MKLDQAHMPCFVMKFGELRGPIEVFVCKFPIKPQMIQFTI